MSELFLNLLDMSLAATWLIAAVILVRLLLKKAPKWICCLLWVLVAVRLICPFSLESKLSLVPETDPVLPSIAEAYGPDTPIQGPDVSPEQTRPDDTVQHSAIVVETPTVETVNDLEVAAIIWLVGMAALLLYALISYLRLRRRVAASMLLHENIRLCDGIDSPFILGLFRPRIYLPSTVTREDMTYVLAHERAHLARRDHWWKPLGFMLLAVYWFNPLVWVAYILLCRDIELACDEKVIREMGDGEKKSYSKALLSCSVPRRMIAACPLAFGEVGVKSRIKSVLNYKKPAFWIIVAALVACIVLAVCFLTDPIRPTVHDVTYQKGYGITAITTHVEMDVAIPTDVLGEDIYSAEGHTYGPDEVVVYETDTTKVYLEHVGYLEQYGEENLYFEFRFDNTILDAGTVRTLFTPIIREGEKTSASLGGGVANKMAWDSVTTYPEGARLYGVSQGVEISVAIKTDVVRNAQDYIAFTMMDLTDITYEKGPANHEDQIRYIDAVITDGNTARPGSTVNGGTENEWSDSFSFQGLMCGEELVYPSPITFTGEDSWFRYSLTYTRPTVGLDLGLRYEDGTEFLLEQVTGGRSNEMEKNIPAGKCRLFIRNATSDSLHPPLSAVELGVITFTSTGAFEELKGTFEDDSTRLYHAIEAAVEKHCALATLTDRAYLVTHHNYLLDKETDGKTLTAYIVTMSNVYLCELDTNQQPVQFDSVERAAVLTFSIGEDGSYDLDEFRMLRDDAAVQSEFPPKAAREAADSIYSMWLDDECDNKALQGYPNAVNGQENATAKAEDISIGGAMKAAVEKLLDGKLPVTIGKLDPEGRIHSVIGHLNAWNCPNAAGYGRGILSHTYQEVDALETSDALIALEFAVDGTEWGIIFYDGTDSVSVFKEGTEYLLQAAPDYEDIFLSPLGTLMRRWYDEAEYLYLCERVGVIPDTGQNYLEAAQEFCEAYEGVHLSVSSGSHYRYNEIFCRVEAAESANELFREKGEIGENTYAFFAYTAFLPESERARNQSIAGNTAPYEGNDPNVPEGALEYMRCGYITLKDDGWHGIIVGSGF